MLKKSLGHVKFLMVEIGEGDSYIHYHITI